MICLDTNYLILGLVADSPEAAELIEWAEAGEALITPAPAWFEFLCGPVTEDQVATVRSLLHEVTAFSEAHAREAARLFNAVGRKRSLRVDAMIAGTAIAAESPLATGNRKHFEPFADHGLEFASNAG